MLSIIVSVYNEEQGLNLFYKDILSVLNKNNILYELIFVNDGSTDKSYNILKTLSESNKHVKMINLSRNYGHEAAMLAGIDNSCGDAVICMDADLQHPPSQIPEMLETFNKGFDVINMVRESRKDGGLFKRVSSKLFYKILNRIIKENFEPNASDFFLISKKVANILKTEFRERTRFLRGYIQIMGFNKTTLGFSAPKRVAGESKYSVFKLFLFMISTVALFSKLPLRLGIIAGVIFAIFSSVVGIYSIIMKLIGEPVPGYTTIVVLMSFMFSVLFIIIGIIGDYIGYLFDENKKRPIYLIQDKENFSDETK